LRQTVSKMGSKVLVIFTVTVLAVGFILPLVWLLSSSLKSNTEIFEMPPRWIPKELRWSNYREAVQFIPYFTYLKNTMIIALSTVIGVTISSSLVAYGFSRIQWPGRDLVFFIVLGTMMIPGQVTMVPVYLIFRRLGWVGTFLPLIVPSFFGNPFSIFLLRQFFMSIPEELSAAAQIDGASDLGIFFRIMLPLAKPALAVIALFQFMGAWNDYMGPLIYLSKESMFTISLGLSRYLGMHFQEWALLMAASVITVTPILILFFLTQRTFIEGISLTGIKG
jgi:multiple sugar transport system permease protein